MYAQKSLSGVSDKHQRKLTNMKKNVEYAVQFDVDNNYYYNYMTKFICETSLDDETINKLQAMNKPPIEFNETEIYVNNQLGEFSMQQPSFEVRIADNVIDSHKTKNMEETCKVIEGHLRYKFSPRATDNMQYNTYADILRGGMSVWFMGTDYINEDSFEMDITVEKEIYPTMCGFDPMATKSHKGDGDFCFRVMAYKEKMAKKLFGEDAIKNIKGSSAIGGFRWTYKNESEVVYMFCEYYEKKLKKQKIVKLSNGKTMPYKRYMEALEAWEEAGYMELPPVIVQERMSTKETICKYVFNDNNVVSYEETDYKYLPLFKFQGSSVSLQDPDGSNKREMIRSYVHNLKGPQRLKNVAGQQVAAEIENTVAHKFMFDMESVDLTQMDQLRNVQIQDVILYRSRRDGNSDEPLQPPREVVRPPIPEIIPGTFSETSRTMQLIMGSFDQLGMQRSNASGEALDSGAMQSARGSNPYLKGYINGLNRACTIYLDLMPKIMTTPRSLPIMTADGKRSAQIINDDQNPDSIYMDFDPSMFNIEISAGVNTEVSKRISLNQMITMSKVSPAFNKFITEDCLEEFIDNMDVRNKDSMKTKAAAFMQKMKQMEAQAAQKPHIDPVEAKLKIDAAKLKIQDKKIQTNAALDAGKLELGNRQADIDFMELLMKSKSNEVEQAVKLQSAQSEDIRSEALLAIEVSKHQAEEKRDKFDRVERALVHHDKLNHEKKKHQDSIKLEHRKLQQQPIRAEF